MAGCWRRPILRSSPNIFCRLRSLGVRSTCLMRAGHRCGFSAARTGWCADSDGPYVALEERTVGFPPTIVEDFGPALDTAAKIVGVSKDFELLAQCERDVQRRARRSSVRRAFAALLPRHHPPARQQGRRIIGDREAVGYSVGGNRRYRRRRLTTSRCSSGVVSASPWAMPVQQVQRAADFVTDSNREDGFANAIERFILGGDRSHARVATAGAGDRAW